MAIRTIEEETKFLKKLEGNTIYYPFVNLNLKLNALHRLARRKGLNGELDSNQEEILNVTKDFLPLILNFLWLMIWEEYIPYLIPKIKQSDLSVPPMLPEEIRNVFAILPPNTYKVILNDPYINRKTAKDLWEAYNDPTGGEKFDNIVYELPQSVFSKEAFFLEKIQRFEYLLNNFSIFNESYFNETFLLILNIFDIIEKIDSDNEEIVAFKKLQSQLMEEKSLDEFSTQIEYQITSFIKEDDLLEQSLYFIIIVYTSILQIMLKYYGELHPYTKAFENLNRFIPNDLENKLTEKDVDNAINLYSENLTLVNKIIESEEIQDKDLKKQFSKLDSNNKMGFPSAFKSTIGFNRSFLNGLYEIFGSRFENMTPEWFYYYFDMSAKRPDGNAPGLNWPSAKIELSIILRILYQEAERTIANELILWKGNSTKWSDFKYNKEIITKKIEEIKNLAFLHKIILKEENWFEKCMQKRPKKKE